MQLTPEQIAKIRQKEASMPEALQRAPLANYKEGWFHVTLSTRDEVPVLGYVVGDAEAPDGSSDEPRCVLTALGEAVERCWRTVEAFHPMCVCDAVQVMPDHIHALLHLLPGNVEHLGRIVGGLMIGSSHCYWDTLGIPWRQMRAEKDAAASTKELDRRLRARWQDRDHTRSHRGPALFVHGYNDMEAIGEDEIDIKREYIRLNPRKLLITRSHRDSFCVRRGMTSPGWTPERIMRGLCADRFIASGRSLQVEAWRQITIKGLRGGRGKVSATLKFEEQTTNAGSGVAVGSTTAGSGVAVGSTTAGSGVAVGSGTCSSASAAMGTPQAFARPVLEFVGNMELLRRPLYPLVCHRADVRRYEEQKAAVLRVAREEGGVVVTACVSPRERAIVKLLQREQLPVVIVVDNGFSEKYKPAGRAFYAVAEGRRLEVSPWDYEFRRREMRPAVDGLGRPILDAMGRPEMEEVPDITREMCMVMNELVRVMTKRGDDWWKSRPPGGGLA